MLFNRRKDVVWLIRFEFVYPTCQFGGIRSILGSISICTHLGTWKPLELRTTWVWRWHGDCLPMHEHSNPSFEAKKRKPKVPRTLVRASTIAFEPRRRVAAVAALSICLLSTLAIILIAILSIWDSVPVISAETPASTKSGIVLPPQNIHSKVPVAFNSVLRSTIRPSSFKDSGIVFTPTSRPIPPAAPLMSLQNAGQHPNDDILSVSSDDITTSTHSPVPQIASDPAEFAQYSAHPTSSRTLQPHPWPSDVPLVLSTPTLQPHPWPSDVPLVLSTLLPTPHDRTSGTPCIAPQASGKLPGPGIFNGTAFVSWENVAEGRAFSWREWRSIESFFFHHPLASVRLLSNSLSLDLLQPLRSLGYDASVQRVDWQLLRFAETAAVIDFWMARKGEVIRKPRFRAAKQSDLARTLYVLAQGGLYFDLDSIFLAPLPSSLNFVAFWRGDRRTGTASNPTMHEIVEKVHNGIFGFSRAGSAFLRQTLPLFLRCDGQLCPQPKFWAPGLTAPLLHPSWDSAGPPIWSQAFKTLSRPDLCGLTLLRDTSVLGWWMPEEASNLTFIPMDFQTRKRLSALIGGGAYAVHLYTSHTGGTNVDPQSLFGHLLNRFSLSQKHASQAMKLPASQWRTRT